MTPLQRLLGDVALPVSPPDADYRDATDERCAAITEAARRDPDRFFTVLAQEPTLLGVSEVVWSVASNRDDRAIAPLLAILADASSGCRWEAASGLVSRRDPRLVDPLIAALRDRSPTVRAVVIEALGHQPDATRAIGPLREALARKSNAKDDHIAELIKSAIERLSP